MKLAFSADRDMAIADKAAYWFALLQSERCTSAQRRAFELWLREAEAHREAYQGLQASWDACDGLTEDPAIAALRRDALNRNHTPWWRNPVIAAALVLAVVSGIFWRNYQSETSDPTEYRPLVFAETETGAVRPDVETAHFVTAVGERSSVTLSDQSELQLNTDTEIRIRFTPEERLIILLKGQALFDVAHNPDRPFSVVASGQVITALGTEFEVRLDADEVSVTLVEGRVSVDEVNARREKYVSAAQAISDRSRRVELTPGERLQARFGDQPVVTSPDLSSTLGWREGRVSFESLTIEEAVIELNRYLTRKLVIEDDDLKELPIGGTFKTGTSESFVVALKNKYPMEAAYDPSDNTIKLFWRKR